MIRRFYKLTDFVRYHDSKYRKPLTSVYAISKGDFISVWDAELGRNAEFEVISRDGYIDVITAKPLNSSDYTEIQININKRMTYCLNPNEINNLKGCECECGSKHTSAPSVHMFYCPLWTAVE